MTREFMETGQSVPVTVIKIEKGRVLVIEKCVVNWCKTKSGNFKGWIKTDYIWGLTK